MNLDKYEVGQWVEFLIDQASAAWRVGTVTEVSKHRLRISYVTPAVTGSSASAVRDWFVYYPHLVRPAGAKPAAAAITNAVVTKDACPPGSKYDGGKPDWSLVQWRAAEAYVRVLTFGAKKYDRDNWRQVPNLRRRYLAAAVRHIVAWANGETKDPESGEHPLAHAICGLMFILEDILTPVGGSDK